MNSGWEIIVVGAYGRDYKTAEEAFADWIANKDFLIKTPGYPSYINRIDAENHGVSGNKIKIRFDKLGEFVYVYLDPINKIWSLGE